MDEEKMLETDFKEDFANAGAAHKIKDFCWIYYKKHYFLMKNAIKMKNALETAKFRMECEGISAGSSETYRQICMALEDFDAPGNVQQQLEPDNQ